MNKYSDIQAGKSLPDRDGDSLRADMPNQEILGEDITAEPVLGERAAGELAEMFRALSDPSRIRIISALFAAEMNVGALAGRVRMSESAVSHQLRGLRQMGLVRARKDGRQVYYALADEHIAQLYSLGLSHLLHG